MTVPLEDAFMMLDEEGPNDDLPDGAIVTGALLLTKVSYLDGETELRVRCAGVNWLERVGMLTFVLAEEKC